MPEAPAAVRRSTSASSSSLKRRSWQAFSTKAEGSTESSSRAVFSSCRASTTAISSGIATTRIAVRAGSRRSASTRRALAPTGPTGIAEEAASGTLRKARPWPVAGASTTIRSQAGFVEKRARSSSSTMILPSSISSLSPGAAAKKRS